MPSTTQLSLLGNAGQAALSIAPMTGPAAPFVAAGGAIVSMVASMIPPRGNFEKFKRTAYPYMLAQAKASGLPVVFPWYESELVAVEPNGGFGVVGSDAGDDYTDRENPGWVARLQKRGSFIQGVCYRKDWDCPNNPASIGYIYRPGTMESVIENVVGGNSNMILIVGAILLFFVLRGK